MQETAYQVVRSNRKSVALVIDNEGNLIVRAPLRMKDSAIEELVHKKMRWIREKQQQVAVFDEKHSPVVIKTGESLMYIGSTYTIIKDTVHSVKVSGNKILVPDEYGIAEMIKWLKSEAIRVISERVNHYTGIMGVTPSKIKLSDAKTRWGSCSAKNSLNFSWRLIMCPLSVIDYVVVHELSHITYKDHSPSFWARVRTVLPNYRNEQDWLKANKKLMDII